MMKPASPANALEVRIDFRNGEDKAQVDGHGLLHGEQIEGGLVDLALRRINQGLAFENQVTAGEIAIDVGLAGAIHRLLRQSTHAKQLLP